MQSSPQLSLLSQFRFDGASKSLCPLAAETRGPDPPVGLFEGRHLIFSDENDERGENESDGGRYDPVQSLSPISARVLFGHFRFSPKNQLNQSTCQSCRQPPILAMLPIKSSRRSLVGLEVSRPVAAAFANLELLFLALYLPLVTQYHFRIWTQRVTLETIL